MNIDAVIFIVVGDAGKGIENDQFPARSACEEAELCGASAFEATGFDQHPGNRGRQRKESMHKGENLPLGMGALHVTRHLVHAKREFVCAWSTAFQIRDW